MAGCLELRSDFKFQSLLRFSWPRVQDAIQRRKQVFGIDTQGRQIYGFAHGRELKIGNIRLADFCPSFCFR